MISRQGGIAVEFGRRMRPIGGAPCLRLPLSDNGAKPRAERASAMVMVERGAAFAAARGPVKIAVQRARDFARPVRIAGDRTGDSLDQRAKAGIELAPGGIDTGPASERKGEILEMERIEKCGNLGARWRRADIGKSPRNRSGKRGRKLRLRNTPSRSTRALIEPPRKLIKPRDNAQRPHRPDDSIIGRSHRKIHRSRPGTGKSTRQDRTDHRKTQAPGGAHQSPSVEERARLG